MDDPLTLAEASALTGLSQRALARRIERGTLPTAGKNANGRRLVTKRDLAAAGLLDLATDQPPRWSQATGELAEAIIHELTARGIRIYELERRVEQLAAQVEEQKQINAEQQAKIDGLTSDR